MKFTTLLLGTAAAFGIAGSAQAADLAVAEAIDYVKVCDAYGAGYYYIPGTDTCLRIGGYVQVDAWYYSDNIALVDKPDGLQWQFKTEASANFTARTMSDLGPVVTFVDIRAKRNYEGSFGAGSDAGKYNHSEAFVDTAYGQIGPLLFGWNTSLFDYGGAFTYDGTYRSDTHTNQIRWSYNLGSWGLFVGFEDPDTRWGITANDASFPDIVAAITGGGGGWDWKLSAAVTDRTGATGWGAQLGITGDLGGGIKLRAAAAYSDDAPNYAGGPGGAYGTWWSAYITGVVALSSNVSAAATFSYLHGDPSNTDSWQAAVGAYWAATSTSEIGLEFLYAHDENGGGPFSGLLTGDQDRWGVHARFKTFFGG